MSTLLGFLLGSAFAGSLVLLVAAWRGWQPSRDTHGAATSSRSARLLTSLRTDGGRRLLIALGAAVPVAVFTRWPVMVGATLALVWLWPAMFGATREAEAKIEALEAVATWTESLRDTIAGSIALEEAIRNTAATAPAAIHEPLQRLVGSLSVHVPLPQAMAGFAESFQDESIDLVAAALILNSRLRGPGLVSTLSALSTSVREELDMRRRIEQDSKTLRRDARTIMVTAIGFAGFLSFFSRQYMAPYSRVTGQLVLVLVIGIFVGGLIWMRQLANVRTHERFLVGPETLAARARAEASL